MFISMSSFFKMKFFLGEKKIKREIIKIRAGINEIWTQENKDISMKPKDNSFKKSI